MDKDEAKEIELMKKLSKEQEVCRAPRQRKKTKSVVSQIHEYALRLRMVGRFDDIKIQ